MPNADIWINRLKHPDPRTRQEAIEALEALGDPQALLPLGEVFARDPVPQLRQLAQTVGKSLYLNIYRQAMSSQAKEASLVERQRAAEILAKAHAKKRKTQIFKRK